MTASLIIVGIFGLVAVATLTALLLDRSSRAQAWRQIAEERRWNHDSRPKN